MFLFRELSSPYYTSFTQFGTRWRCASKNYSFVIVYIHIFNIPLEYSVVWIENTRKKEIIAF